MFLFPISKIEINFEIELNFAEKFSTRLCGMWLYIPIFST